MLSRPSELGRGFTVLSLLLTLSFPPSSLAAQSSRFNSTASGSASAPSMPAHQGAKSAYGKVRVRVPCNNPKSPVRVIDADVVSVDASGTPAVDRNVVAAQAGHDCRVGGRLEIEQSEEQKAAAAANRTRSWIRKGQAVMAMVLESRGHTGAAQALTGFVGISSMLDENAGAEEKAAAMKMMAGSLIGSDASGQALREYISSSKPGDIGAYAAAIDQQQANQLAAANSAAGRVGEVPVRPGDNSPGAMAAVWSGSTTATSRDAVAASVKYPVGARAYEGMVVAAAAKYGVDPDILRAMATIESNFNPNAVSSVGARGLVQIMPGTARGLGFTPEQMFNPQLNLEAAAKYVSQLQRLKYVGNNLTLIAAAYNAGPGNVLKYGGVPPFKETQNHVRKVNAVYYALKARAGRGVG